MFKPGDRVAMTSATMPTKGGKKQELVGTVQADRVLGLVVRWDDWPLVTRLPNPNVRALS